LFAVQKRSRVRYKRKRKTRRATCIKTHGDAQIMENEGKAYMKHRISSPQNHNTSQFQ